MGASNVAAAYRLYAGRVPATSMQLLAYMALVSVDADPTPWYGEGHQALAVHALGREPGTAGIKAVERAIRPLAEAGAITTTRKAAVRRDAANTVRYRLHLVRPAERPETSDVPRKPGDVAPPVDPPRPPETVPDVPRKPSARPPETVRTSPENRGTEEKEEYEEREEEQEVVVRTEVAVARAREAAQDQISPTVLRLIDGTPTPEGAPTPPSLFPAAVPEPPGARLQRSPFRRPDHAAHAIADAQARRAARIAAHQAAVAAGETS